MHGAIMKTTHNVFELCAIFSVRSTRLYFISFSSTSLTWNIFPTLVPPTSSKLQRQGFTQTLEVVYRVLCFMGNEAKHGELSIPLEKRCSCYGHWRKQYEKIKPERDSRSSEAASPTYGRTLDKTRISERLFVTGVQYFHLLFGRLKGDDCFEAEKKLL